MIGADNRLLVMIRVAMTSELSSQQNDAITYFTRSIISRHWELFFQNLSRKRGFSPIAASMFMKIKRNDGVQQESSCYFGHGTQMKLMSFS